MYVNSAPLSFQCIYPQVLENDVCSRMTCRLQAPSRKPVKADVNRFYDAVLPPAASPNSRRSCPVCMVQGGSYAIYSSSSSSPVGMDLVEACRRTCQQMQAAAPSQMPAPPPPAILI